MFILQNMMRWRRNLRKTGTMWLRHAPKGLFSGNYISTFINTNNDLILLPIISCILNHVHFLTLLLANRLGRVKSAPLLLNQMFPAFLLQHISDNSSEYLVFVNNMQAIYTSRFHAVCLTIKHIIEMKVLLQSLLGSCVLWKFHYGFSDFHVKFSGFLQTLQFLSLFSGFCLII